MRLAHARVRNFRSLTHVDLGFGGRVSVLYGANGQGKTNFLEALYMMSNLQSFRTRRLRDLVSWGVAQSRIESDIEGETTSRIRLDIDSKGKRTTVDGRVPASVTEYLSHFRTILFSSFDLHLVRGDQELRRRFVDRATFVANPSHLPTLRAYHRVLKQRNALLRSRRAGLAVWDEEFVRLGLSVHEARSASLRKLEAILADLHRDLSGTRTSLTLSCRAPYAEGTDPAGQFLSLLHSAREKEYSLGFTTIGPHRDAFTLLLGTTPADRFASQGQQRVVALSLKLSMLYWHRHLLGDDPVFLLDDPASELDSHRLEYLGRFLSDWPGQVIITGTGKDTIPLSSDLDARFYLVKDRTITAC